MALASQSSAILSQLERVLSKPRLSSYGQTGTLEDALCRYLWNTAICESLYPSFQILEVGFRNAIHREISSQIPDPKWLTNEKILYSDELEAIRSAKNDVLKRSKPFTEDILIAELRFGFWTSLLDSRYETMWHKIIVGVFPHMPRNVRTRREASKLMHTVRRLRNAALHHHSIWHWRDLQDQHKETHLLIGYICGSIAKMAKNMDRFPQIYSDGFGAFRPIATAILK
jgi:hypothetical protein